MPEKHLKGEFMVKAPVNKIIPFSNVDGPGNRFAIFFQSCPFRCLFCHNPETINLCNHCGTCIESCPVGALSLKEGKVEYNADICVACDTCIRVCPSLSSPKVRYMSVAEILEEMKPTLNYIRGITVSGGESMVQAPFLLELFTEVKKLGLTCLIDTNGYFDFTQYEELLDLSDGVMLDIKAIDDQFHREMTFCSNETVIKNLHFLLEKKKLVEARTVIFSGFTEQNKETVVEVAKIIQNACAYHISRYRKYGVRADGIAFFGEFSPTDEEMHQLAELAKEWGALNVKVV